MGKRGKEERDLRSLDRRSMHSIFRPLDPAQATRREPPEPSRRNAVIGPFTPSIEDPLWKSLLSLLWVPALLVFVSVVLWLQVPAVPAWIAIIAFCIAYAVFAAVVYRRR